MLPGFTGCSSEKSYRNHVLNTSISTPENQGVTLAGIGGGGSLGPCTGGCTAVKSKCVGFTQYYYCFCGSDLAFEFPYGSCFIW